MKKKKNRKIGRPRKTHCMRGHEYTPENTRYHHNGKECRICTNANAKIRYNASPELRAKMYANNVRRRLLKQQAMARLDHSLANLNKSLSSNG